MRKKIKDELDSKIQKLKTVQMAKMNRKKKFITIESYHCMLENGKTIPRDKILKNGSVGSAVLVLPITDQMKTIVTIQPRVFTTSTVGVGVPAGYKEAGETDEEAARRELFEETGYTAEKLVKLCSFYPDDGCSGANNIGFLALGCKKTANQHLDPNEYIELLECSFQDLVNIADEGYIYDGGTQLLIEKAKNVIEK